MNWGRRLRLWVLLAAGMPLWAHHDVDVTRLSLEELMDLEVTTAGKKEQPLGAVPAAMTVITAEDIRNSGATSLPELLARVPGFYVGRINGQTWAVAARSGAERFSTKLLVMVDGRSVYTPFFSGVLWEQEIVMLEDVERIEVQRGPGGAVWGANAVNGVVNVITKDARETVGGLTAASVGTDTRRGAVRYGFQTSHDWGLRIYGVGLDQDAGYARTGSDDDWRHGRLGMRLDAAPTPDDHFNLTAELFQSTLGARTWVPDLTGPSYGASVVDDERYAGGHLMGSWTRCDDGYETTTRAVWDRGLVDGQSIQYLRDTVELDFQCQFSPWTRHDLVWGGGYRWIRDETESGRIVITTPDRRTTNLVNVFAQDEFWIFPAKLSLTGGVKLEHNEYTGLEVQPSMTATWLPTAGQTVWATWSRAVRTPSRVINDGTVNLQGTPGGMVTLRGSTAVESERLDAWEIGYRRLLNQSLAFDVALYLHRYDDLITFEGNGLNAVADNQMTGSAYGIETSLSWRPTERQHYYLAYTFALADSRLKAGSLDAVGSDREEDQFPEHQVYADASYKLREDLRLNATLRYVDNLRSENVDAWLDLDVGLRWQARDNLTVWAGGKNLLDGSRQEFGPQGIIQAQTTEVRRSASVGLIWEW